MNGSTPASSITSCSPPAPTGPSPLPADLIVTVRDGSTGNAIAGADVSITGPSSRNGLTDAFGSVQFSGISPGSYNVSASHRGYAQNSTTVSVAAGTTTTATVTLTPLTLTVIELGFHVDFTITRWNAVTAAAGAVIADPVWKLAANPNLPVCYKKASAAMSLAPKVRISPAPTQSEGLSLRATVSSPAIEFRLDGIPISATEHQVSGVVVTSGALEDKVQIANLTLTWFYSWDAGATWHNAGTTGTHKVYQVYDTPIEAPLLDLALEKGCDYSGGESAVGDIALKIAQGMAGELSYNPGFPAPGHPLGIYGFGQCLCADNAELMRLLCRSLGIAADVMWVWGGTSATRRTTYTGAGSNCSFMVIAPVNDAAPANPHFTYHAQTLVSGTVYDPSYGNAGLITLAETAPGAARQTKTGGGFAPWSSNTATGWTCPHP